MAMQPLLKPNLLRAGDRIAAVSLSSGAAARFPHRYQAGCRQLEAEYGVTVTSMPNALRPHEFLAANPQARADDLIQALEDDTISGIFSTIGGDDSIRLLPLIDPAHIRRHPKPFLGMSDTTITHFQFLAAGVASFYGPAIMTGFAENCGMHAYTRDAVRRALFEPETERRLPENPEGWTVEHLDWQDPVNQGIRRRLQPPMPWRFAQGEGVVCGRLIGGCIEVLDWLRGTSVWPAAHEWEGSILFIETSEEAPEPLAMLRMLRCLAAVGVLERVEGVLLGRPGGAKVDPARFSEWEIALLGALREAGREDTAVVTRMDFGHTDPVAVLPFGSLAEIDCVRKQIRLHPGAALK
ncbi:MAG: LD-carboxypeptidase [Armatimonadetes bacterium]|nr:LD-carboxypeptidase [Armatimonadota bacterium]MDE2205101.1 LD-carboxypeptidase [Armatimonadota bacterium]